MVRVQLSVSLNLVLCQNLLRKVGGGRVPAYEIMKTNSGIRNMIRDNKMHQAMSMMQTSAKSGMSTLDDSLQDLVKRGVVAESDAARYITTPPKQLAR